VIRAVAFVFSVLLHPLFIPVWGVAYLAFIQQGYFTGISARDKGLILLRVAVNTVFFPLLAVLLLKGLGFIKSVFLRTKKERIIPFVASNIFYFWMFLVFKNQPEVPPITTSFMLGIFLASSAGLLFNSFFKISMHALGMGTFCGILFCILFSGSPDSTFLPLMIILLLTGIVCTSRLILSDHSPFDIYSGLFIGILCQMAAWLFYF
jgi:membrane-associated phospholipid phosphatase